MYSVFYGTLGLFGWALIAILMATTLSTGQLPRYSQLSSPIAVGGNLNPGMGVRPHLGYGAAAIANSADFTQTYELILADYAARDTVNGTSAPVTCDPSDYSMMMMMSNMSSNMTMTTSGLTTACIYDLQGYLQDVGCNATNNYGYNDTHASPCILVKLNNVNKKIILFSNSFVGEPPRWRIAFVCSLWLIV
jgi:hypothetical protein